MKPVTDPALLEQLDSPMSIEINGTAADLQPVTDPALLDELNAGEHRAGIVPALETNPDEAARARALAQQTGIPASIVEEDPKAAERKVRLQQLDDLTSRDPALGTFLSDPANARIAHDDAEQLSVVGEIGRSFAHFGGAALSAVPSINSGLWNTIRAVGELTGMDSVAGYAKARADEQGGFAQTLNPTTGNRYLDAAYSGVQSTAQSLMFAPLGVPALLTSFGLTSFGQGYDQAREGGLTPGGAALYGAGQGAVEVGTELIPTGHLVKAFAGGKSMADSLKKFAISEAFGEQLATAMQDFQQWQVLNPDKPASEFIAERPGRALDTLIATAVSVGASSTVAHAVDAVQERARERVLAAAEDADRMQQLFQASEASKTRARDPEAFRQYLEAAVTDEHGDQPMIYVDGRAFAQAVGATGVSYEVFRASAPELAEQMNAAVSTGGDVGIPAADFATVFAGTPQGEALLPHVRTSVDAMSATEAATFAQNEQQFFEQEMQRAISQQQGEQTTKSSEEIVRESIAKQLRATGRFTDEVNNVNALIASKLFSSMAAKLGTTAEDVYRQFDPRILGENPAAPGEVLNRGFDEPVINIGLNTNDGGTITPDEAVAALKSIGVDVVESAQHTSDTEPTLVAKLSRPLTPEEGDALSVALRQDAVAQAIGMGGDLFGPKKEDWGPFNPDFFLRLDGRRASEAEHYAQSIALRSGAETLKRFGLKPGKKYKTRAVAAALEARQRRKFGSIAADDRSDTTAQRIANWMATEVEFEMRNPEQSGVGWYSEKYQRALDTMAIEFPELATDQNARNTMTAIIAITSNGQKVVPNFAMAMDIYSNFRQTGRFESGIGHTRMGEIETGLARLQQLYDEAESVEAAHEFLMKELTVRELKKIAKERGLGFNTNYQVDIKLPMAAVVLGPKLGAFYANLMGAHGYLTMDRWWSRTFNRYRGTLLAAPTREGLDRFKQLLGQPDLSDDEAISATVPYRDAYAARGFKNGSEIEKAANTLHKAAFDELEDAPFNSTDRTFMLNAVNRAAKILSRRGYRLTVADIQAILWYYEKRLYGELGARQTADISYEDAAQRVVAARAAGVDLAEQGAGSQSAAGTEGEVPPGEDDFVEDQPDPALDRQFTVDIGDASSEVLRQDAPATQPLVGIHFSRQPRAFVDGRYYGGGARGEEANRVMNAEDRRLRDRVYVYIDQGNGVRPEAGVGGHAHEIRLPRLYNWDADPLGLRQPDDPNGNESRVLDAGFDGYYVGSFGNGQGAAVILGPASHGLAATPTAVESRGAVAPATPIVYKAVLPTAQEIDKVDVEKVREVAPSAKLRFGLFSVDISELPAAREAVEKMGVKLPERSLEQSVFHGSPHSFERFSFDHIGTGEGAQAFGWGLYFAEGRSTAAHYFTMLSGGGRPIKEIKLGHLTFGEHDSFDYTRRAHLSTRENVLASLAEQVMIDQREWDTKPASEFQQYVLGTINYMLSINEGEHDVLEALRDLRRTLSKPGAVSVEFGKAEGGIYKLDIPDAAIERMLLWDAPLSKQSEFVKQALMRPLLEEAQAREVDRVALEDFRAGRKPSADQIVAIYQTDLSKFRKQAEKITGEEVYHLFERKLGSAEAASRHLASLGIPGNRYLDGVSRRQGDGTYNVVVWDQALLDEMNKQVEIDMAQQQGQPTGPRGTFNPSTNTIALLEKADLSTFLHELGHFGLEMMVEIAAQPGAPQQVLADVTILMRWFGVADLQTWNAMSLDQKRPFHEKFAEGFETYLFEGKSPSVELNGAFARVRSWMLNVYKSLKSMRVQLTPEVRGVFDRMLATNDQIAEQSRIRNMAPLFSDPSQSGMTVKDWRSYQELGAEAARDAVSDLQARTLRDMKWLSNAKGRALKKLQDSAKEIRKGVRAEVAAQVDATPVYAAMEFIERGTMAERDLTNAQRAALDTVAGGKTKLALPVLKDLYGEGPAAPWRYLKQTLVAAEDGAHPDAVAAAFGFDSGDALVRAILAAEPRQQLIDALTDKRMLEEHGDLTDPESIERAAEAAIHNEARIRFVATEMKALQDGMRVREKAGETTVTKGKDKGQTRSLTVDALVRAATQYAEAIVARTVVRRLNPALHARTAAAEAKLAAEAMKAGDLQTALAHKRNQLLHERTSRAMSEAQTEFEKMHGYLRKFSRSNRARGSIDADYVEQIENLLAAIDTRNVSNKRLESLASLRKWIAAQEEQGLPVSLDPELIESLQTANVRDLSMEQMRGLVDQVRSIEHLGKLKKKLLTARDQREFDETVEALAASIREHGGEPREVPFAPGAAEHDIARRVRGFFAEHRKLSSLARQMDGVVDDGPLWRTLIRTMNDAGNRETTLVAAATKALTDIFRPLEKLKGGLTGDKRLITSLGKSLSRGERLSVVLNWGNEANRQRVLNTVPLAAVEEILSMLTREEAAAVQSIWDQVNAFWPDIAAKEKRVTGTVPEKVEASPFTITLADGTTVDMGGGYYPIVYESELSDVAAAHEQAQIAKDMQAGAYTRSTTRRGHTKKRAQKVGEPLRFTLDVIERHLAQVIHDLSWHEWLIDANRILRDKRITSAIREHYGNETLQEMKKALSDIATGDLQREGDVAKIGGWLRAHATAATMAFSATTALLQPFGLFQSIPRVGAVWIMRGVKHWVGDAARFENSARLIREKSEMMRHRSVTFNRDIREVTNRIHRGQTVISEVFDKSMFIAMQKLQLVADVPTWWGAYEKAMAEVDDESRAVALADQAVLDAQGGGTVKDLAGVQRGGEFKKALSMFYSYFSATYQLTSESTAKTNFKSPASVAGWLADMVVLSVVPTLAQSLVYAMLRGGGDDDKDRDWGDLAISFAKDLAGFWLNTIIWVRELSGVVQGYDYSGPAGFKAIVEAGKLVGFGKKAADPDKELTENDYRRAVKSVLTIMGLPAVQVDRSWRGWEAYDEGKAGPGAILLGPPPKD